MTDNLASVLSDPLKFQQLVWPHINLYDKQVDIIYSVRDNDETYVPAAHQMGKDFISAIIALWFLCSRRPSRVVTTSVKYDQLNDVLWGEIRRLLEQAVIKLPIDYSHLKIRQIYDNGEFVPLCELVGQQCANKHEGLFGRHLPRDIPRTLVIFDEASGIDQLVYEGTDTWAHRKLIIGNPYPCTNFFFKHVKQGDLRADDGSRYYRKIIRIKADDSPNVRLAMEQIKRGETPTKEILVPGLIDYDLYLKRRKLWDSIRQCIGLDGMFYEGAEVKMFPPEWLNIAHHNAQRSYPTTRRTLGIDTGEGGDKTSWCVVDAHKLLFLEAFPTPNTAIIPGRTIELMRKYDIKPEDVLFDRGGGGKEHADTLRMQGYKVRTVGFGETATDPFQDKRMRTSVEKEAAREQRYTYKNRRAEMYGLARNDINPDLKGDFGIDDKHEELKRQLSLIPYYHDQEGRIYIPSKDKRSKDSNEETLREILGCSPDEADSFVLAIFGQHNRGKKAVAGALAL